MRDLVSDKPLTLAAGQSIEVSSAWPLDLSGRWHGWIEVTRDGKASLVGDEQAFGFWVKLPRSSCCTAGSSATPRSIRRSDTGVRAAALRPSDRFSYCVAFGVIA